MLKYSTPAGLLATALLTTACVHENTDTVQQDNPDYRYADKTEAIVSTVASDYSAGAHSLISSTEPRLASNNLAPTGSDLTVKAHGEYFYRIERLNADTVTKFHYSAPDTPIWQFSTQGTDEVVSGNPTDLVFANANEAYVLRYGSTTAWIVNPGVSLEDNFKVGELDLSAYADSDGIPEMHQGVIVNGKLFITLQRQDTTDAFNWVPGDAYVAVFDLSTQTEIDTGKGQNSLQGILLPIKNPGKIVYSAASGLIYVQGIGSYTEGEYVGGIATIDPDSYATSLLVDDDSPTNGGVGKIANMAILSASQAYLVGYAGWGDTSLYRFDPTTGIIDATPIAGQANKNIADIEIDNHGMLWLSDQDNAGVVIIDTENDQIEDSLINTELNPDQIVFINS